MLKTTVSWTIMMEAAITSETSLNFYNTVRLNISEDSHFHTRLRESFKTV
jgi:hypothetical protein